THSAFHILIIGSQFSHNYHPFSKEYNLIITHFQEENMIFLLKIGIKICPGDPSHPLVRIPNLC
ncbi:MAG: hypothetical protein EGQ17_05870, partial [Lachnospiraceae bacterium]|nr:hypothetical protein [Lachnospiraceae bacterium]